MKIKPVTLVILTLASFGAGTIYCAKKMGSPKIKKAEETYDAVRDFLKDKNPANV